MIEGFVRQIAAGEDVRGNLSRLREALKEVSGEPGELRKACEMELWEECLDHEDAKVRKNTASLYRDLSSVLTQQERERAAERLLLSYRKEQTLFVKSFYLKALAALDTPLPQEELAERLRVLKTEEQDEESRKHIREEKRALEALLPERPEVSRHIFKGCRHPRMALLVCDGYVRETLWKRLGEKGAMTPWGVRLMHEPQDRLEKNRVYERFLWQIRLRKGVALTKANIGEGIASSELLPFCREVFEGAGAYTFRLELFSTDGHKDTRWLKGAACAVEECTKGRLRNTASEPDTVLCLLPRDGGQFQLYLEIPQVGSQRFAYRRYMQPTSMTPASAAKMAAMCRPYMQARAQVLDPFCGVGTLLIERNLELGARENYGVDLYGKAIEEARENTAAAGVRANYINRDYFDFRHRYPFDEIITEFPRFSREDAKEADGFYQKFFRRSMELTAEEAWMFLLSSEEGKVKKYIRLSDGLALERQIPFREHEWVFVIRKKGDSK